MEKMSSNESSPPKSDMTSLRPSSSLHENVEPRGDIYKFSDEVFSNIFEELYTADLEGIAVAKRISHVSQRFRAIALSTPLLWTTVTNTQTTEELCAFLERSRALRIKVLFFVKEGASDEEEASSYIDFISTLLSNKEIKWLRGDDTEVEVEFMIAKPSWVAALLWEVIWLEAKKNRERIFSMSYSRIQQIWMTYFVFKVATYLTLKRKYVFKNAGTILFGPLRDVGTSDT